MDPMTALMIAGFVAKSGMSIYGNSKTQQALDEQRLAIINASNDTQRQVIRKGNLDLERMRYKTAIQYGSDVASTAGSGLEMSGSAEDVVMQNYRQGLTDERVTQENTQNQLNSVTSQLQSQMNQITSAKSQANMEMFSSIISAGMSAASGISSNNNAKALSANNMAANKSVMDTQNANAWAYNQAKYGSNSSFSEGSGFFDINNTGQSTSDVFSIPSNSIMNEQNSFQSYLKI